MSTLTLHDAAKIQQVPYRVCFNGSTLGALADLPEIEFGENITRRTVFNADDIIVDLEPDKVEYAEICVKMADVAHALQLMSGSKNERRGTLLLEVIPPARGVNLTFTNVELLPKGKFALNTSSMQYIKVTFAATPDKNSKNLFIYA